MHNLIKRAFGLDNSDTVLNFQAGQIRFEIKDGYLNFRSLTKKARIPLSDIETVSVDDKSMFSCTLKIIGKGTELASLDLYKDQTDKAQDFVLKAINKL